MVIDESVNITSKKPSYKIEIIMMLVSPYDNPAGLIQ